MNNLRINILSLALTFCCISAMGWGRLGHDAIAYIAEQHLTPQAKEKIEKYLDAHSIVYYASWPDWVRYTEDYMHTSRWHTCDMDSAGNYTPSLRRDAVEGINTTVAYLRDYKNMSDSANAANIKLLVHLVGDIHCPGHAFDPTYDQKNIKVDFAGHKTQMHAFWDTYCLSLHQWNYLEMAHQLDRYSDEQRRQVEGGTPVEWIEETWRAIEPTYTWFENGREYNSTETYLLMMDAEKVAHRRIPLAGYRLAALLNDIFK